MITCLIFEYCNKYFHYCRYPMLRALYFSTSQNNLYLYIYKKQTLHISNSFNSQWIQCHHYCSATAPLSFHLHPLSVRLSVCLSGPIPSYPSSYPLKPTPFPSFPPCVLPPFLLPRVLLLRLSYIQRRQLVGAR